MSTDSDSSDDIEMEDLFSIPLTKVEIKDAKGSSSSSEEEEDEEDEDEPEPEPEPEVFRPLISRRAKRRSMLYGTPLPQLDRLQQIHQQALAEARSAPKPIVRTFSRTNSEEMSYSMSPKVKFNWMRALKKVKSMEDPWEGYGIHNLPTERVIRHSYHPLKKKKVPTATLR